LFGRPGSAAQRRGGGAWLVEEFFSVVDARYAHGRPTVIVSNLTPDDVQRWSPRIWSRVSEAYEWLEAGGMDRRGR
jgi:hypothetical protein